MCVFALMAMCIAFCLLATVIALQDWLKSLGALGANGEHQFAAAQAPARHLRPRRDVTARNRGAPRENRLSSILGTSSPPRERRVLKFRNVVRICVSAPFLPCVLPALSAEIHW